MRKGKCRLANCDDKTNFYETDFCKTNLNANPTQRTLPAMLECKSTRSYNPQVVVLLSTLLI
jgi:hypothetical protein